MTESGDEFRYACATCGEVHVGMPTFGWDSPRPYLDVPEAERAARVQLGPDFCVIDDAWFFVRGCLDIPVHAHAAPFSWGAWVSLSRDNFLRYAELHDDPQRTPGARFVGWLASAFPGYPDRGEMPLRAALHVRAWPLRPFLELEPTAYPLAVEQREGITAARVREIARLIPHAGAA